MGQTQGSTRTHWGRPLCLILSLRHSMSPTVQGTFQHFIICGMFGPLFPQPPCVKQSHELMKSSGVCNCRDGEVWSVRRKLPPPLQLCPLDRGRSPPALVPHPPHPAFAHTPRGLGAPSDLTAHRTSGTRFSWFCGREPGGAVGPPDSETGRMGQPLPLADTCSCPAPRCRLPPPLATGCPSPGCPRVSGNCG